MSHHRWPASLAVTAAAAAILALSVPVFAQSVPPEGEGVRLYPNASSTVRVVATASVQNAKIVPQSGPDGVMGVTFDMVNGSQVQTGVRFGLRLTKEAQGTQELVDEVVFPGEYTLKSGERKSIEAEYLPPQFLRGPYTPWLVAKTSGGIVIGLARLQDIALTGTGGYVDLQQSSCHLRIDGRPEKYTPQQGVDVSTGESLTAVCEVTSYFEGDVQAVVALSAHKRSAYGEKIDIGDAARRQAVLKPGNQIVELPMPKFTVPQAYSVVMAIERDGRRISGSADFHFVIQGPSATIQNIRLDKSRYEKGDSAEVSLYWSASADDFYGSRSGGTDSGSIAALVQVTTPSGNACSEEAKRSLEGSSGEEVIRIVIDRLCVNPTVSVEIIDANGATLDQKTVETGPSDQSADAEGGTSRPAVLVGALIALIALIGFLVRRFKHKGGGVPPAMKAVAFMLAAGAMLVAFGAGAQTVSAAGATYEVDWHIPGVLHDKVSYYVALDKDNYMPGEDVVMTATSGVKPQCGNGSYTTVYLNQFPGVTITNPIYVVFGFVNFGVKDASFSGSNTQKAPMTPGVYEAVFKVRYYHHGYYFEEFLRVPFTVGAPPEPSNVTASCPAPGNAVTVNWTPVSGYNNYYVRIHDETVDAQADYTPLVPGGSYTWSGAMPGRTYSYWVHTANSDGTIWSTPVPSFRTATVTCPVPPTPTNMTGTCPAPGTSATMTWTAPAGYSNFAPRLCDKTTNPTCDPSAAGFWRNDNLAATTWTVGGLTPGHTYGAWVHTVGSPNATNAPDFSCPLAPACGSAAKTYLNSATSFGSDTYCSVGAVSSSMPAFPNEGEGSTWTCSNAGATTNCTAYREMPSVTQGFTLVADPTLIRGRKTGITGSYSQSKATQIRVVPYGGFTGQVSLTAAMPVGAAEPIVNPDRANSPGYVSSLFANIPGKAPVGTFEIIVTGRSGNRTATTSVWLDISDGTGGQI